MKWVAIVSAFLVSLVTVQSASAQMFDANHKVVGAHHSSVKELSMFDAAAPSTSLSFLGLYGEGYMSGYFQELLRRGAEVGTKEEVAKEKSR